jgi:hypothetical protein
VYFADDAPTSGSLCIDRGTEEEKMKMHIPFPYAYETIHQNFSPLTVSLLIWSQGNTIHPR